MHHLRLPKQPSRQTAQRRNWLQKFPMSTMVEIIITNRRFFPGSWKRVNPYATKMQEISVPTVPMLATATPLIRDSNRFSGIKDLKFFAVDELVKKYPPEERIYRLRCVEAWSMVIPWMGFPLAKLLKEVEPKSEAKFVRFETIFNPDEMPGQRQPLYPWPYQEGLRLDEAMHNLTILATGLYGGELPAQNGGGIRLVVPWKYGFKSIKAVVRIELTAEQPKTLWSTIASDEYGFYANVNPEVDHPRWSQRSERRIGELGRRDTLMFNGYGEEVAMLYNGMDLKLYY